MAENEVVVKYKADVSDLEENIKRIIELNEELADSVETAAQATKSAATSQSKSAKAAQSPPYD